MPLGIMASARASTAEVPALLSPALWLRAKDLVGSDGSTVSAWVDNSSNHHSVIPGNANNMTLVHNSTPKAGKAVRFPGNAFFKIASDLIFASTEWPGLLASAAFDGNSGTYWHAQSTASPQYIGCRAGPTAVVATGYSITAQDGNAPLVWEFQGANSVSGSWTTLDSQTVASWSAGQTRSYSLSGSTPYLYYRIYITSVAGASYARIRDITITGASIMTIGMPATGDGEMWVMVKGVNVAGNGSWATGIVTNNHYAFSGTVYEGTGSNTRRSFTPSMSLTSAFRRYRVAASGTDWNAYLDAIVQATATGNTKSWYSDNMILGKSPGAGEYYLDSLVAEFMLFPRALTSTEATNLDNYLIAEHLV